jgi:hypothetical protein
MAFIDDVEYDTQIWYPYINSKNDSSITIWKFNDHDKDTECLIASFMIALS